METTANFGIKNTPTKIYKTARIRNIPSNTNVVNKCSSSLDHKSINKTSDFCYYSITKKAYIKHPANPIIHGITNDSKSALLLCSLMIASIITAPHKIIIRNPHGQKINPLHNPYHLEQIPGMQKPILIDQYNCQWFLVEALK